MKYSVEQLLKLRYEASVLLDDASELLALDAYCTAEQRLAYAPNVEGRLAQRLQAILDVSRASQKENAPIADLGGQSKLNARDLACFEQVASALGEVQAESELQQVIDSGLKVNESISLSDAFVWAKSPQGHDYWREVLRNA